MGIYVCISLCLENEEELVVEEEVATLTFLEQIPSPLRHKASPGAFTPFLVVLNSLSLEMMH
jgi:hypothetical protein